MNEVLLFTIGFLIGSIIVYVYMKKFGHELTNLYTDSMLKNKLLKAELKKNTKKWNGKKKKFYHGKKKS